MAPPKLPRHLIWRGNQIQYKRAVPGRFREFVDTPVVRISLRTNDLATAVVLRDKIDAETERHWKTLASGSAPNERERYLAAIERARLEGFSYKSRDVVQSETIAELLERIEHLERRFGPVEANDQRPSTERQQLIAAMLGAASEPTFTLSGLVEVYEELTRDERRMMSDAQRHKWRLPHTRAQRNIIDVVGDKALQDFTRADALRFRSWWLDRIESDDLSAESANKDFSHIGKMIAAISDRHDLDLKRHFRGLRMEGEGGKRVPFSSSHILDRIVGGGALDNLNVDARAVLLVMVETGARPSEISGLRPADINLDGDIPFIRVAPYRGRVLKTRFSERDLPLVGVAVDGARMIRDGAQGYKDRGGALSAVVGKFFEERGLTEGEATSLYSLRHSFKDRLTEAGAPDLIDSALMGHKFDRPDYGKGPSLALKVEWLRRTQITGSCPVPIRR